MAFRKLSERSISLRPVYSVLSEDCPIAKNGGGTTRCVERSRNYSETGKDDSPHVSIINYGRSLRIYASMIVVSSRLLPSYHQC